MLSSASSSHLTDGKSTISLRSHQQLSPVKLNKRNKMYDKKFSVTEPSKIAGMSPSTQPKDSLRQRELQRGARQPPPSSVSADTPSVPLLTPTTQYNPLQASSLYPDALSITSGDSVSQPNEQSSSSGGGEGVGVEVREVVVGGSNTVLGMSVAGSSSDLKEDERTDGQAYGESSQEVFTSGHSMLLSKYLRQLAIVHNQFSQSRNEIHSSDLNHIQTSRSLVALAPTHTTTSSTLTNGPIDDKDAQKEKVSLFRAKSARRIWRENISVLDLSHSALVDEDMTLICEWLRLFSLDEVKVFSLRANQITRDGVVTLITWLLNQNIEVISRLDALCLDLASNNVYLEDLPQIALAITALEKPEIFRVDISSDGMTLIVHGHKQKDSPNMQSVGNSILFVIDLNEEQQRPLKNKKINHYQSSKLNLSLKTDSIKKVRKLNFR